MFGMGTGVASPLLSPEMLTFLWALTPSKLYNDFSLLPTFVTLLL